MLGEDKICKIETWYVKVQTPRPITLGGILVSSRDFVFLRVTTNDGLQGVAYSLTRGAPLDVIFQDLLGPRVIGTSSSDISEIGEHLDMYFPMLGMVGLLRRAQSLLDIALWDLLGRRRNVPVYKLLGNEVQRPKILLVVPFRTPDLAIEKYASQVAELATLDVAALKLYPENSLLDCAKLTRKVRSSLPATTDIVLDVAWRWRTAKDVIETVRVLSDTPLAWLEDPVPLNLTSELVELRKTSPIPIGAGDEVSNPDDIWRAIQNKAVDVLRLDATCAGGLTGVRELALAAAANDIPVSTHIYPEIHRHIAIALPGLGLVETFTSQNPFWGLETLIQTPSMKEFTLLPEAPGLGIEIRWDQLTAQSTRYLTCSTE
jgi:L-alanine-DL-glutamate epimerase-like enolase superfamily enzyme